MTRDRPLLGDTEALGTERFGAPVPAPIVNYAAPPAGIVFEPRHVWGALPPKGNPGPFEALEGTVCHYTAGAAGYQVQPDEPHDWCRDQVRSIQRDHRSGPDQSDISYNALVCAHGVMFEGRVIGYKGG